MRHGAKPIYGRIGDWRKKIEIDALLLTQKIIGAKFASILFFHLKFFIQ